MAAVIKSKMMSSKKFGGLSNFAAQPVTHRAHTGSQSVTGVSAGNDLMRAITSSKAKLNTESQSKKSPKWSKVMISLSVKRETKPMSACRESV